jgi:hypothetical protein
MLDNIDFILKPKKSIRVKKKIGSKKIRASQKIAISIYPPLLNKKKYF